MNILTAYEELGSYRAAAALCGTTHKTVRRVVERRNRIPVERPARARNTDLLAGLIARRVKASDGRIIAKRLLPVYRAAGYTGSARNLRRAVAAAKAAWRRDRRTYRPWVTAPGEHLVIDWGAEGDLHVFCAVLAWSRSGERAAGPARPDLEAGLRAYARPYGANAERLAALGTWVDACNFERTHTALAGRTPMDVLGRDGRHWLYADPVRRDHSGPVG